MHKNSGSCESKKILNAIIVDANGRLKSVCDQHLGSMGYTGRGERLLGGIQAGVAAFHISLLWLTLYSRLDHHSFWTFPNLLALSLWNVNQVSGTFGWHTWTGLSLHLLLCVSIGGIASQIIPLRAKPVLALSLGVLVSTGCYYLADGFLWRWWSPMFAVYSRQLAIFLGYVLIGLSVGLYSLFVRSARARDERY